MYKVIHLIISISLITLITSLCSNTSPTQMSPLDISSQEKALYINLDIHSSESVGTTINVTPQQTDKYLGLEGNYGEMILDENINFMYGESTIQTIYSCTKMRFYMQSINKFWVSQYAAIEIIIECTQTKQVGTIHTFAFNKSLLISIPLIIIDSKTPNTFIEAVAKAISINSASFEFPAYDFDKVFLENDDLNQSTQFYFFNANNPLDCASSQSTWVVLNKFIKISQANIDIFKAYFTDNNLNNDLAQYYLTKQPVTLDIKRNYYISENFSQFEYKMVLLSKDNGEEAGTNNTAHGKYLYYNSSLYNILLIFISYLLTNV